jgi:hypothetical protein|tara:strand:- start:968 stop:1267 length:300 start_codon:yes stop_codon:yes gene_type:complete
MLEKKLQRERYPLVSLPRKKDVVISDNPLFKTTVRYDDCFYGDHYRLTFSTQFKPLSFLGKYASTFVRRGSYSENSLDKNKGWRVHRAAPHYLEILTGF